MRSLRIGYVVAVIFLIIILLNSSLLASPSNISFQTHDGKRYSLADFRGKYVLVNLFSSYCPPCMVELKVLERINQTCSNRELQIISLMIDREGAVLLPKIVSSRGLTYPVGLANQEILKFFSDFSITPTTYLLDPKGNRIEKFVGYKSYNDFLKAINRFVKCN